MHDLKMALKKKAVEELIEHLDELSADDIKPKAVSVEVAAMKKPEGDASDEALKALGGDEGSEGAEGAEGDEDEEDLSPDKIRKLIELRKGM